MLDGILERTIQGTDLPDIDKICSVIAGSLTTSVGKVLGDRLKFNVTAFTDCGVLVRDGGNLFVATGATKEDAEDVAEEQHPGSTQVTWGCNDPKGSGPASYRG